MLKLIFFHNKNVYPKPIYLIGNSFQKIKMLLLCCYSNSSLCVLWITLIAIIYTKQVEEIGVKNVY